MAQNGNMRLGHFHEKCHKDPLWNCKRQGFQGKIQQQEEFHFILAV
jgi:hypothetical protein